MNCSYKFLFFSCPTIKIHLTVKAGPTCVLCEFVMTQLDSILASNATQVGFFHLCFEVFNLDLVKNVLF